MTANLELCAKNDNVLSAAKFKFCQGTVKLTGLQITLHGMVSSDKLQIINKFSEPKNITDASSWFELNNQVAWTYSASPVMSPFWGLVKPNQKFIWCITQCNISQQSKDTIIEFLEESVILTHLNKPASRLIEARLVLDNCCSHFVTETKKMIFLNIRRSFSHHMVPQECKDGCIRIQ